MPLHTDEVTVSHEAKASTKVFQAHGNADPLIPPPLGVMTHKDLVKQGVNATLKQYPMAHSACDAELQDVARFLHDVLGD
jgi:phospholipase/carboxylesterase